MWLVKYGDKYLHDPRVSVFVADASLSPEVNTSAEFKFTIAKKHPLYESLREHDIGNEITVYNDGDLIFCGTIVRIDKDFQLTAEVTCQSEMAYLNKSIVPPFSTVSTEPGEAAPATLGEFFEWLIEKHNSQVDVKRRFIVGRNDGDAIAEDGVYLSSDSYNTTGSVIKDSILENFTSYITIEHKDSKRIINLIKDFDPVNAQVIDFGINLLDFTDGIASDDVYTVMMPLGAAMKDTKYTYFDGYSLTEDRTPDPSKQYYNHDTYAPATLKNVGTEEAPVYKFESGVRYFEKVARYTYAYAPWDSCNPNVTYYYNNKLRENKNLYYFEYGYQYFETDGNGNYWITGDRTPNWDKTYYRYEYSSISNLQHFSKWEDGDRSGYDYYTRKASEFYIATSDSTPVHGKTYYTSPSSVSYTACDIPLMKFDPLKSYFEYDGHADESNNKLTLGAGPFEIRLEDGYIKTGDKIIATDAVKKYGLMTTTYTNTDIKTRENLEKYGLIALKATVSPVRSLEIKAIDLAMLKPDYKPIRIGQYIRARSRPHNLDSYFLCSKIDYDLNQPDNTTFTLGTTFDTLTGQQNKRIKSLNATINTIYEAAAKISDDAKANATIAGQAQEKIDDASAKANDAQTKANDAQTKADDAQSKANSAIQNAKDAADKATDAAKKADDASENITIIDGRVTEIKKSADQATIDAANAKTAADEAKSKADSANEAATAANTAAGNAQNKANEAYTAASNVQSQVGQINEEITGIKQNATDLRNDLEGQIKTVTNTMTADYAKKTDLSSVESSLRTEISSSAAGIKSEVSQTYATKTELNSIQVGGRNLLIGTSTPATHTGTGSENQTTFIYKMSDYYNNSHPLDGKQLTMSFDWETTAESGSFIIQLNANPWLGVSETIALSSENKSGKSVHTFICSSDFDTDAYTGISIRSDNLTGTLTIKNVMLEFSNKPSSWQPAPEDTNLAIANLANNVETNYSTKSEVKQLSDQVSSTVSAVEEVRINAAAAQKTASDAAVAAANAQTAADTAKTNAENAKSAADAANTAAATAQSKADEASRNLAIAEKNLSNLQSQANATDEQLSAAQTAVANAKKAADDAQIAADAAKANAATAQSTADTAKANAATAQSTADAAKSAADKAQRDVDTLTNRVTKAETQITQNADAIELRATKTEVTTVKNIADTAKSTADSVKSDLSDNYSTTTQMNSAIEAKADSITSTVSKTYQVKGDYATNSKVDSSIESVQTQITQTDQEVRVDFNKSIASASSDLQSQMNANDVATNKKISEINKYIRFIDGKIVLGETGNELMLTIQNDRVSFTQAGVEVAYFSNNNLYVKRAEILTTMKIGNYEFTPRTDGGLALRKRSE